jgi:hypothetical protein
VQLLLFAFPLFMWMGVCFLLLLVKHHGSVAASAANVVRKIIAVAFSFVYFGRAITPAITIGAVLVFGSIVWRARHKDEAGHGGATVTATQSEENPTALVSRHGTAQQDDEESVMLLGDARGDVAVK